MSTSRRHDPPHRPQREIFRLGQEAARLGEPEASCPFTQETLSIAWKAGYRTWCKANLQLFAAPITAANTTAP